MYDVNREYKLCEHKQHLKRLAEEELHKRETAMVEEKYFCQQLKQQVLLSGGMRSGKRKQAELISSHLSDAGSYMLGDK